MTTERFRGLGVCPGIAFGKVHIVDRRRVAVPHYHLAEDRRELELQRLEHAITASEQQFERLQSRSEAAGLDQVGVLLQAHAMILRDTELRDATRRRITDEGKNAEWALKETIKHLKRLFDRLDQDYFKERRSDIDFVGDRILRNLIGAETDLLDNLSADAIVVAYDLSPADTVNLARYQARAFVTEGGGPTSHTAILARAMNVPCVLNARGVMNVAGSGDEIIVDGQAGQVVLQPDDQVRGQFQRLLKRRQAEEQALLRDRDLPSETRDGVEIELLGNIEVSQEIATVMANGAEGIGLYRTEFLYLERPSLQGAMGHFDVYSEVVRGMQGRPVTIRTVDVGGDKFVRKSDGSGAALAASAPTPVEDHANPALGLRAIRLSLKHPGPFREQLEGILRASAVGRVQCLLPMVTTLEELRTSKQVIQELQEELRQQGVAFDEELAIGVMIETPAAAVIADLLARECDFFAIGTNDLIQYALATDRGNRDVAYLYRPCHPAVLRILRGICETGEECGVPVSVCGEMAADPFHIPLLLGLGIRRLSMTASSIPIVKRMLRRLEVKACEALVADALQMATAGDVEEALTQRLRTWAPDLFQ